MNDAILVGLGAQNDPQAQQRALEYFEQLKSSAEGWELCANAISSGIYNNNDHVRFFCFQVVEFYIKGRYASAEKQDQEKVRLFLMGWLQQHCEQPVKDPTFLCNKAAQLFALAFIMDFPERWPTFFVDLLNAASRGEPAIWIYMRILMAIDTEVVDRDITHTDPEYQRNTLLKDAMREHSVVQMVDSWYHIINNYQTSQPQMCCFCLGVIGAYVSWIDINLIANDKFVSLLLKFMTMPLLRESSCDCIHEIINKGMDPMAKTRLIESFTTVLNNTGVFNFSQDEESDYLAKLAKLVNGIGVQLIQAWQKLIKSKDVEKAAVPLEALEKKVPLMLSFLRNEDDDVSGAITQFAHDYLSILKQLIPLNDNRKTVVKKLVFILVEKMKFDDSYNFQQEGEDEAMFQEYRKELKVIFNNLGALDSELLLSTVHEICAAAFNNWRGSRYQDVEIGVSLLYQLGEAFPASHGQHFSGEPNKATAVQDMMRLMVTSKVCCFQHCSVQLQYFETAVRYDRFFGIEPQHIAEVLMAFLDERGLRNPSSHVRSRTAYLFSRFVKAMNKQHLQNYLEDILTQIHDLLALNSPDNGLKHYLSGDDQFFMYETAGILVVQSQFPPEKKQELMKALLAPIVSKFDGLLNSMIAENDEERQTAYAECLSQAMAFASRSSKGFSASVTMKHCGCVTAYTDTLKVFLHALDVPVHRALLHSGVRQFLHRMVVCLDAEVLPFVPVAMENLLKNADAKELHDFVPLINQLVCKFKQLIVPFLGEVLMPLVTCIFQALAVPADERDQVVQTDKRMLRRSYFSFLSTLVTNNVTEVLSVQEPANLLQVLVTLIQGAVEIPDPQAQKSCFNTLKRLVEAWADKNGLDGFVDFVYESIVPACFLAPLKVSFDLSDAQTVLALNECAMCLKSVLDKRGEELIVFLQSKYLPTMNVSAQLSQEFCEALKANSKVFKNYFKSFFLQAKT